ncbi:MAG: hypothetical protein GX633_08480 [Clostridiales bacterium]|jgi:hypothetical protein|nr:hypothetical protein [Clostridiales bacterium]
MNRYFFFSDDHIWTFRSLAKARPKSLFDNAYLRFMRSLHEKYDMKIQLNVFYSTHPSHGGPEFTLSEMPDIYKPEFIENSCWLRLAFHAYSEFPQFPYINVRYDKMKSDFDILTSEIIRFAGEETLSHQFVPHYLPVSSEGVKALYDCGIDCVGCSYGFDAPEEAEKELDEISLQRLNDGRYEDTSRAYYKNTSGGVLQLTLRGYNHIPQDEAEKYEYTKLFYVDKKTGMKYKRLAHVVLNLHTPEEIKRIITPMLGSEFIGIGNHEQYFYPFYRNYEPDYRIRVETAIRMMHENGYESAFVDEINK